MLNVMAIRLIVNADDFGYSASVNAAVARARAFGALTSASLMVTGEAAREAASIAGDNPDLAVGLHLALSRVKSALPRSAIPGLVDINGRFPDSPISAGLRYCFSPSARRQLADEIEAQFEAFARLGIGFSHIDGHQHMHAHPVVLPIVIRLAEQYGTRGIRVPNEPFAAKGFRGRSPVSALAQAYLARTCRRLLRGTEFVTCDHCIGGPIGARRLIHALDRLRAGTVEVYFHPSVEPSYEPLGPNPADLAALLDPALRDYIAAHCRLATYESICREAVR